MKRLTMILLVTVMVTGAYSQLNPDSDIWGDVEQFDVKEVPEKWEGESAVVLYQRMQYSYTRDKGKKYKRQEVVRRRIKLQDKAAINEFSTFYYVAEPMYSYEKYPSRMTAGFKIIKPDGKEEIVDLDGESVNYGEVPSFFKPKYVQIFDFQYRKAAVPNLEVGDIIDFYYLTEKTSKLKKEYVYAPFIFSLSGEYPIVDQTFDFVVGRGHFLNFKTYNGAGELKETTQQAYDKRGNPVENENRTYEITDSDRDKRQASYFNYTYRNTPTVKFQVYYIPARYVRYTTQFVGEVNVPRSASPSLQEIETSVSRRLKDENFDDDEYEDQVYSYVRYNYGRSSDSVKAVAAYNYFRFQFMYKLSYLGFISNPEIATEAFIETMMKVFNRLDVEYDLLIGVPRTLGSFNDLLLSYEIGMMLRVKGDNGEYFYLSPFDYIADYTNWDYLLAETDLMVMDKNMKLKTDKLIIVKSDKPEQNREFSHKTVTIDEEFKSIDLRNEVLTTGRIKNYQCQSRLYWTDYAFSDVKYYNPRFTRIQTNLSKEEQQKQEEEIAEEQEKQEKERRENFEERWEDDDFDVEEYKSFEILKLERFDEGLDFVYAEELKLNSLIKKAGKNYIVEVGRLIGDQLSLDEEDKGDRDVDAYINYPKQYADSIVLEIPAGYEVANLEDFNVSVDNEAGSFIASAKLDGNYIIIESAKTYKTNFVAKQNWNLLEEMLLAAEGYMNKKLLLKKEG